MTYTLLRYMNFCILVYYIHCHLNYLLLILNTKILGIILSGFVAFLTLFSDNIQRKINLKMCSRDLLYRLVSFVNWLWDLGYYGSHDYDNAALIGLLYL